MTMKKTFIAASIALAALSGCNSSDSVNTYTEARFATFNLSFDRATYEDLVAEMSLTQDEQSVLIERYKNEDRSLTDQEIATAEKVIQIRNVAEIIQRVRPNAFVLAEFNNDGNGEDMKALNGFHDNYLAHSQNDQQPIAFAYKQNIATNTGLPSDYDLNLDGTASGTGDDAWGFGFYHGQYAFAVFSQFEIDKENVRTFQHFKWKDMPGEKNIEIVNCDVELPADKKCGDAWYSDEAWAQFPLSSKNHADIPVIIPQPNGEKEVVHFLVSHPAPPIFDNPAKHNTERNRAELQFWNDYIDSKNYMYDDKGVYGGLPAGSHFVVAGDLNADHQMGDGDRETIANLISHSMVNVEGTLGSYAPTSNGGEFCLNEGICTRNPDTPHVENITSTSGLRLDYVIPSATLDVKGSGVFWPAGNEDGYYLVYDEELGNSKGVSSDHRMVWVDLDLTK
ncbi:endonuclease/exonuclease/phosphatase family protein (plasmid) [Photobacterium sp. DA100]|uniref:endonuclease/exonuclease/phosphatase family protein n=1 Tax=Photobacterium sp. DA100 TaxID=3027472 RepID=UPI002479F783|nr:endonuclease/exonuclease/phosphatase family protein [Photobacterium sp. DA100]WEM45296.1 endonuclease/exonuclease/phosphatase family protein [Photobacterium sp. DA100]